MKTNVNRSIVVATRDKAEPSFRRPGVVATIIETISRKNGATIAELVEILKKKFPERNPTSMETTAKLQANINATHKEINGTRGRVYFRRES